MKNHREKNHGKSPRKKSWKITATFIIRGEMSSAVKNHDFPRTVRTGICESQIKKN